MLDVICTCSPFRILLLSTFCTQFDEILIKIKIPPPQHSRGVFWSIEILPLEIVVVEDFAFAPLLAPRRRQLQLTHHVVGETG